MRKGVNPQKYSNEKNKVYFHRVIITVHIPNRRGYYEHMVAVFEKSLDSLINSINKNTTVLTIVNNNSIPAVNAIIENRISLIDKYVSYNENKGKVYAVLSEARSVYEPFVTIADADVLFMEGWENAVVDVFKTYHRAGVVAPLPSQGLALNNNNSIFFDKYVTGKIKKGKIVDEYDCDLYIEGLGNPALLKRDNRSYNWRQKQYYLNKKTKAVIGSGHFVATYRSLLFKNEEELPLEKFKNGYEDKFVDCLADKKGYYRLSTVKTYVYHLGTHLDQKAESLGKSKGQQVTVQDFKEITIARTTRFVPFVIRKFIFRVLNKIFKL